MILKFLHTGSLSLSSQKQTLDFLQAVKDLKLKLNPGNGGFSGDEDNNAGEEATEADTDVEDEDEEDLPSCKRPSVVSAMSSAAERLLKEISGALPSVVEDLIRENVADKMLETPNVTFDGSFTVAKENVPLRDGVIPFLERHSSKSSVTSKIQAISKDDSDLAEVTAEVLSEITQEVRNETKTPDSDVVCQETTQELAEKVTSLPILEKPDRKTCPELSEEIGGEETQLPTPAEVNKDATEELREEALNHAEDRDLEHEVIEAPGPVAESTPKKVWAQRATEESKWELPTQALGSHLPAEDMEETLSAPEVEDDSVEAPEDEMVLELSHEGEERIEAAPSQDNETESNTNESDNKGASEGKESERKMVEEECAPEKDLSHVDIEVPGISSRTSEPFPDMPIEEEECGTEKGVAKDVNPKGMEEDDLRCHEDVPDAIREDSVSESIVAEETPDFETGKSVAPTDDGETVDPVEPELEERVSPAVVDREVDEVDTPEATETEDSACKDVASDGRTKSGSSDTLLVVSADAPSSPTTAKSDTPPSPTTSENVIKRNTKKMPVRTRKSSVHLRSSCKKSCIVKPVCSESSRTSTPAPSSPTALTDDGSDVVDAPLGSGTSVLDTPSKHLRSSCTLPCCSGKSRKRPRYIFDFDEDEEDEKLARTSGAAPAPSTSGVVAAAIPSKRFRRSLSVGSGYSTNDELSDDEGDMELDSPLPSLSWIVTKPAKIDGGSTDSEADEDDVATAADLPSPPSVDSGDDDDDAVDEPSLTTSGATHERSPRLSADDFLTADLPRAMAASPFRTRLRAVRKMGLTMPFWKCGRCAYWHYHSGKVLKHQGISGH